MTGARTLNRTRHLKWKNAINLSHLENQRNTMCSLVAQTLFRSVDVPSTGGSVGRNYSKDKGLSV